MKICLNISNYLTPCIRKSFSVKKQAFAQTVPFILEDLFPNLNILYLDKGRLVLEDNLSSERIRVVCSSEGDTYDIAPSFTKGVKRDKQGLHLKSELELFCDKIMFVSLKDVDNITIKIYSLGELFSSGMVGHKGVVTFE